MSKEIGDGVNLPKKKKFVFANQNKIAYQYSTFLMIKYLFHFIDSQNIRKELLVILGSIFQICQHISTGCSPPPISPILLHFDCHSPPRVAGPERLWNLTAFVPIEDKSYQWFGATVETAENGAIVVSRSRGFELLD
jgi:hypothetical protein